MMKLMKIHIMKCSAVVGMVANRCMGCDDNGLRNQDDEPKYGERHEWTVEMQRADTVLKPKRKGDSILSLDKIGHEFRHNFGHKSLGSQDEALRLLTTFFPTMPWLKLSQPTTLASCCTQPDLIHPLIHEPSQCKAVAAQARLPYSSSWT
jgi:ribosomal protein L40E